MENTPLLASEEAVGNVQLKSKELEKDCVAYVEELENGHNPTLQYNDSLKTTGLSHVAVNNGISDQKFNKKQIQYDADANSQAYPKALSMDSATKRLKVGNIGDIDEKALAISKLKSHNDGDKGGIAENVKYQKDATDGASNSRPILKSVTKG
ncbi:hypothetical protein AgCh_031545 [Apium graveolens]